MTLSAERRQCDASIGDFPTLAGTGLHAEAELDPTRRITGRTIAEIEALARPGRLSTDGFLGRDDDMLSVLRADNGTVESLGLTHPDLARPLFHVLNMMQKDIDLGRWNMRGAPVAQRARRAQPRAHGARRGRRHEGRAALDLRRRAGGASWFELTGAITDGERAFLEARHPRLGREEMDAFVRSLTRIRSGDMEPFYMTSYHFYEGRTLWRTDPIALAFVFGLRTIQQIEAALPGRVYRLAMARQCPSNRAIPSSTCLVSAPGGDAMNRPHLMVGAATLALVVGCSQKPPAPGSPGTTGQPAASAAKPGAFTRQQLVEDARELARILEDTHPDPYTSGGGRLAFHRRLHQALNAIPDEGMTKDEFFRLLRPFLAGVGDAHTNFTRGYAVDPRRSDGVPLRLKVVEETLVVVGVERARRELLGSRLLSVEGVPLAELVARQRRPPGR